MEVGVFGGVAVIIVPGDLAGIAMAFPLNMRLTRPIISSHQSKESRLVSPSTTEGAEKS